MPVSLTRQIQCVQRELRLRRQTYPRWVEDQRLTQEEADAEILAMAAVLDTLRRVQADTEPQQIDLPLL